MWMIPSQFGDSLQQFARAFADKDDDGVFRYEAETVNERDREMAEEGDPEAWFDTSTDPELARALAEARAVANKHVDDPDPTKPADNAPSSASHREITSGSETGFDFNQPVSRPVDPVNRPDQQPEESGSTPAASRLARLASRRREVAG